MQDPISEKLSPKKKLVQRVWFWILIGLVLLVVIFFSMLPVGVDYGIKRYIKDQGADQVSLEDVDFNPITGRMTLKNLNIVIGSQTVLSISEAMFDLEWGPFINKRFVLKRVAISDTELTVKGFGEGRWQVGGINLPDKSETAEPSAWNFGLEQVSIENSSIKFISQQLSSDLKIEQATISELSSWLPVRKARLEFEGQLNDGILQVQLDVAPFGNDINAAGQIKLTGLSLTPFAQLFKSQSNALEGRLNADLNFETRQTASAGFSYHQDGRLNLQKISTLIEGADFASDGLDWDGTLHIEIPESDKALRIKADGQLVGTRLSSAHQNENLQIQQENLDWKGKIDYAQSPVAAELGLNGTLAARNTNITGPEINLSEEKLDWKGVFNLSNPNANADTHITLDGEFEMGPLALNLIQQKMEFENAGLQWQGKLDFTQNQTNRKINANGQLSFADLKMVSPQLNLAEEMLRWQGVIEFSSNEEKQDRNLLADGALDGSHLWVDLIDRNLKFEHRGFSWKGRLDSGERRDFSAPNVKADVILSSIQILHSKTGRRLFDAERIDLQAVQIEGLDEINAADLTLNGLALPASPEAISSAADPPFLRLQEARFNDIRLSRQKNLAIDSIQLKALTVVAHRDVEGKWPAIASWNAAMGEAFSADQEQRSASDTDADEKSDTLDYRIGQIDITGDSGFQFKDESVRPVFDIDLSILEARLSNLDSHRSEEPASIKLLLSDKENARLSLDGTFQPFAGQLNLDCVGKIEALELPFLSPYVTRSTGYRFISGELEADVPVKITRNELDGKIDLTLYNPKIQREKIRDPENKQQGKIQLNMTLDSALRMLRDKQNNVKIKIPIKGDIRDPQFSVADAINKVLARTLQTAAISTLKYMLGPYGIGISVAQLAYEQALKIRLNPVQFAPGSDALDEAAIDYLQRVADIMKEYAEVQVVVCGIATESDRAALDASPSAAGGNQLVGQMKNNRDEDSAQKESATPAVTDVTLLDLAENRTQRIKDQLVNRHEITAKRIIDCNPSIDSNAKAKPRAALEI